MRDAVPLDGRMSDNPKHEQSVAMVRSGDAQPNIAPNPNRVAGTDSAVASSNAGAAEGGLPSPNDPDAAGFESWFEVELMQWGSNDLSE